MKTLKLTALICLTTFISCSDAPTQGETENIVGKEKAKPTPTPSPTPTATATATAAPSGSPKTIPLQNYWSASRTDNVLAAHATTKGLIAQNGSYIPGAVEGCVFEEQVTGTVPLVLYFSEARQDNFHAATTQSHGNAIATGYRDSKIIEGYVWPANSGKPGRSLVLYWKASIGDNYQTTRGDGEAHGYSAEYIEAILPDCTN